MPTRRIHLPPIAVSLIIISLATLLCAGASAAPSIANIAPRGLQIGGTTTITIDGGDLLSEPRLVLPVPIAKQELQPGGTAGRVQIAVTLDASVTPGIYQLRVANSQGISSAMLIGVDSLPQQAFAAELQSLPAALDGNLAGSQILGTAFDGKKGQRIVVDVESRRLGAKLKPVVRLYDPRGTQIAWSPPVERLGGDARCEAVLPEDGRYSVDLHDMLYRAAAPGFFRLKIGELHYADAAFPLGVTRGQSTSIGFVSSSLSADTKVEVHPLDTAVPSDTPAPIPSIAAMTGARPRLIVSDHAEIVESMAGDENPQGVPQPPVAINGRLSAAGEEDRYLLTAKPGSKLRFDVLSHRLGSSLDGVLILRGEQGNELARNDDRPSTSDPGLDFTVPANVDKIIVALQDLQRRGGNDFVYRIAVQDISEGDFSLSITDDRINIPAGGTQLIQVQAIRAGYDGPIQLSVEGLPEGMQIAGDQIAAGSTIGLLTVSAPTDSPSVGLVTIVGRSTNTQAPITRVAMLPAGDAAEHQPWLRSQLGLAITQPAPIGITWASTAADDRLLLGGIAPLAVKINRAEAAKGDLRLRLVTTQITPKKKVKEGNQEKEVDDVERSLRLESSSELAADVSDAAASVLVPNDLAERNWDLVIIAELLSADKKNVVAQAVAPTRTFKAVRAIRLELTGANNIEAKAGGGETGKFTGKITRLPEFNGPVTLAVAGLPQEYPAPQIQLAADQVDFEFPVRFPAEAKPAELKDLRLTATVQPDSNNPKSGVQSNDVPVTIKVVAGDKPAQE